MSKRVYIWRGVPVSVEPFGAFPGEEVHGEGLDDPLLAPEPSPERRHGDTGGRLIEPEGRGHRGYVAGDGPE